MESKRKLEKLLYSRQQAAELLGDVDVSYLRRLEQEGRLRPIRLSKSPTAKVFYGAGNIHELIEDATK